MLRRTVYITLRRGGRNSAPKAQNHYCKTLQVSNNSSNEKASITATIDTISQNYGTIKVPRLK